MPGESSAHQYWVSISCILTAVTAWKLYFDSLPSGFVQATNVSTFRNMSLMHCHLLIAIALAALGAGYVRAVASIADKTEEGSEEESASEDSAVRVTALCL